MEYSLSVHIFSCVLEYATYFIPISFSAALSDNTWTCDFELMRNLWSLELLMKVNWYHIGCEVVKLPASFAGEVCNFVLS